jgi:hypothetical protein
VFDIVRDGSIGWRYEESLDLSSYDVLTLELSDAVSRSAYLKIYDTSNYWGEAYSVSISNKGKSISVDLHNMKTKSGSFIDPSHIRIVAINSKYSQNVYVKGITLSHDETNGMDTMYADENSSVGDAYDLSGRKINISNDRGNVYIKAGKKYLNR